MAYGFVPPGTILPFGGGTAPSGWLLCDGSAISRSTYAALYSAINTGWGYGDNSTTFNLPDMRGRFPRGRDGGAARDPDRATRTASSTGGNTGDNVGSVQGHLNASHNHGGNAPLWSSSPNFQVFNGAGNTGNYGINTLSSAVSSTSSLYSVVGSDGGLEARPINANVNYIIKI